MRNAHSHLRFSVGRAVRLHHAKTAFGHPQIASVLDAGCGEGNLTRWIARRVPSARVVGIDSDTDIIDRCAGGRPASNLTFRCREVGGSHLGEAFDVVTCTDVMEHIADDQGALDWLATHLRPRGLLIMHVPAAHQHHHFSLLDRYMVEQVASGEGPHLREGYEADKLSDMARLAGLEVSFLGHTFYHPLTRAASDLERWTHISGYRYLKLPLLPFLVLSAVCERRPTATPPGYGLLMVARKPEPDLDLAFTTAPRGGRGARTSA
jgi:2-polyprenyl-3-methyl-5-hydroxy-6-metoxy-1,4-benzoquinol methylase